MKPILQLEHVGVAYPKGRGLRHHGLHWALEDVSLQLHHGETLGVVGRNGVGKTTLLRLIAGIIEPDRGRIRNAGVRASLLSLQVGFIPQLTGRENAVLSGMLLGASRQKIERAMASIVEFAELDEFIDEPVGSYSSGMKARLGFSVAMQADPDVMLIDEVLGVGDSRFRKKSAQAIRERIHSDRTVILVSHNSALMRELCDRVVWIEAGKSRMEDQAETVLRAYEAME